MDERLIVKHKAFVRDEYERGCEEESGWNVVDSEERSCPEVKPSRSFIYFEPHHASVRATSLSDVGAKLNPFRAPETQPNQSRRRQAMSLAPRHKQEPTQISLRSAETGQAQGLFDEASPHPTSHTSIDIHSTSTSLHSPTGRPTNRNRHHRPYRGRRSLHLLVPRLLPPTAGLSFASTTQRRGMSR